MRLELYSWGGAEEVTGSKHFIQLKDKTLMIDCGAFQGKREEAEKKNSHWPFDVNQIDGLVLTHAHYDHCGLVPLLPVKGFEKNIYATPASRDLASLIMMDSAHIQAKDLEYLKKRAKKNREIFDKKVLYTEKDVLDCLDYFMTVSYHRPFHIYDGIKATFYDAGHILGSAITHLEIRHNGQHMDIGFSGDLGRKNLPILRDPDILPPVDFLVMESTYGNRLHDPVERVMDQLDEIINRTITRGGKIIIPAFAMERTQELVYYMHLLNDHKRIPKIPIYVDSPMATNATAIFRVHQECYDEETRKAFLDHHKNPFGFNELRYVTNPQESKALNRINEPCVIISSSGMCEAGRILHHLLHNIESPKNTVLIVGYMAEHTLGRKIQERHEKVKIFGDYYKLDAEVKVLNTFSAHADYNDILEYVSRLDYHKLKEIFLVHGEREAQQNLKKILEEKNYKVTIVKAGEKYTLQN
jgi:metallo-beta-lactamase family protein